jgi:hypothetical protein
MHNIDSICDKVLQLASGADNHQIVMLNGVGFETVRVKYNLSHTMHKRKYITYLHFEPLTSFTCSKLTGSSDLFALPFAVRLAYGSGGAKDLRVSCNSS